MKISAAVSREGAPHPVIEELDLQDPRGDEILVRVVASGICHTDIRSHAGMGVPVPKPIVLGHEGAGVVEAVGAGVVGIKKGDHVVLSGATCGACEACASGRPTHCTDTMRLSFGGARSDGSVSLSHGGQAIHSHFFAQSSFASYMVTPARGATVAPKELPLTTLAPLGCGVITGAGAVIEALKLKPGQSIAIFGVGAVGLSAIMGAKLAGAGFIAAVDVNPQRLTLAETLGADAGIPAGDTEDVVRCLHAVQPGRFDHALIAVGVAPLFDQATRVVKMGGAVGFVAAPPQGWNAPMLQLLATGRRIQAILGGDAVPRAFIPKLVDAHVKGRFPIDRLIKTYPFTNIATAFNDVHAGRTVKPVLVMGEA
jgi:aryl-alcohol dehydrogenase